MRTWSPGEVIVVQDVWRGSLWAARPVIVVDDGPDEGEFALLGERGLIEPDVARRVRDEAATVIERIAADAAPFDSAWPGWRPDPSWELPELPAGWEVV